jgi:predicted RND superfamily exporter protein
MMKMYDQMETEAEAYVRVIQDFGPRSRSSVDVWKAYHRGDKETVGKLLPELESHPQEAMIAATDIAVLRFFLGDTDKGFEWLERAYSVKEGHLMDIQWHWGMEDIRADPRYIDLLKRLGLRR